MIGPGQAHGSVLCHRHEQVHRRWHLIDPHIGTADLSLGLGPQMGILLGRPRASAADKRRCVEPDYQLLPGWYRGTT